MSSLCACSRHPTMWDPQRASLACVSYCCLPCCCCCPLQDGSWDEISGEAFLRKLLSMPIEEAKYNTVSAHAPLHQHSQQLTPQHTLLRTAAIIISSSCHQQQMQLQHTATPSASSRLSQIQQAWAAAAAASAKPNTKPYSSSWQCPCAPCCQCSGHGSLLSLIPAAATCARLISLLLLLRLCALHRAATACLTT